MTPVRRSDLYLWQIANVKVDTALIRAAFVEVADSWEVAWLEWPNQCGLGAEILEAESPLEAFRHFTRIRPPTDSKEWISASAMPSPSFRILDL